MPKGKGSLSDLQEAVCELSPAELMEFREWFAEFDADLWDQQIEADINAGKLDQLAERALRAHAAGNQC
ncbi:MAG TPA: hypothetical protein VGK54_18485 [Chloroflexota bacterium]